MRPTFVEAYHYRGLGYVLVAKYKQVLLDYDLALEIEPKHIPSLYERGGLDQTLADWYRYLSTRLNISSAEVKKVHACSEWNA